MAHIDDNKDGTKFLVIKWHTQDIRGYAANKLNMNLTVAQANEVLELLDYSHDADIGVNWEVVKQAIQDTVKLTPEHEAFFKAFTNEMSQYPLTLEQYKSYALRGGKDEVPDETRTALYDARNMWQVAVSFGKQADTE